MPILAIYQKKYLGHLFLIRLGKISHSVNLARFRLQCWLLSFIISRDLRDLPGFTYCILYYSFESYFWVPRLHVWDAIFSHFWWFLRKTLWTIFLHLHFSSLWHDYLRQKNVLHMVGKIISWVFQRYASSFFTANSWVTMIKKWRKVVHTSLP